METKKTLFLLSNGSSDIYKNNTLTHFTNKLPTPIDLQNENKYEIAIESVGFSCLFRNIKLPEGDYPSFIITNQFTPDPAIEYSCRYEGQGTFQEAGNNMSNLCYTPQVFEIITEPVIRQNDDLYSGNKQYFYYMGRFLEKLYTEQDLITHINDVNKKAPVKLSLQNGLLDFSRSSIQENPLSAFYHVLIHPTMMETFDIQSTLVIEHDPSQTKQNISSDQIKAEWKKKVIKKVVTYKGHLYYLFKVGNISDIVRATKSPIGKIILPNVVKVVSNNISPQIFNNSYSNDMVVFCPDFKTHDDYYFHEFESKQYVPLLNSSLTDIEVKLCDENNNQLQLLSGVPSILKLNIRRMSEKSNFHVRLTSAVSKEFQDNKSYHFRVKLPTVLSLSKSWNVALTSISYPNTFKTFLPDKNSRGILLVQENPKKRGIKIISDEVHTIVTLVQELVEFFSSNDFGEVKLDSNNRLKLIFKKECIVAMSNHLLRVLGCDYPLNLNDNATKIIVNSRNPILRLGKNEDGTENYILQFNLPINLDALQPNYMIAYTNFIESSIIGGIYSKILRVIPVSNQEKGYIISDFKHKEFIALQNTEISEIEIVLRSHDGEYVYFGTNEDLILNLEFSTSDEDRK